ncbi:MAG: L-threonylcarbamoyladenylate synthase [Actinomycetota bacterium]|nr:L-threonylcarbamoyladenylate synthase [Actinomycetota bacterium]
MLELAIDQSNPDAEPVGQAAEALKTGGLVVFPTDTVYGLGAALFDRQAVRRIFELKGRQSGKGLIAMIADPADLARVSSTVPRAAKVLIDKFWPGPLTLVLPAAVAVPRLATINGTIGVRMPDNNLVKALVRAVGQPLATTSANLAGRSSPTGAAQAKAALEAPNVDIFIDGGDCALGIESTVVDMQTWPPTVVREGAVSRASLWEALGIE